MSHLGVMDASLLIGFRQASLYGAAGTAYARLLEHQLGSPKPYEVPPAWVIPPESTGGCRRADLRRAFQDLFCQAPKDGTIVVQASPLSQFPYPLAKRGDADLFRVRRGWKSSACENFIEAVLRFRGLHEQMGVIAMVMGENQVMVGEEPLVLQGDPVYFRAETYHPLGGNPLRIELRFARRPRNYWGESLTVHVAAHQKTGEIQLVSGHPKLVSCARPLFSDLVGLLQYFDACVQSAEVQGVIDLEAKQPLLTDLQPAPRPPRRKSSPAIGETHLYSRLSIGRAKFEGPLIVWAGTYRKSLRDADRQFGSKGYVLLCQTHDEDILRATPGCRYRLSAGLERIGSPALRLAQARLAAGEEYVMAHGLQTLDRGRMARVLAFPHSDEDSSMMVGRVQLVANGQEAGVRFS